jgi:Glycosyl hydrolases family 2, TIM barrel domain
MSSFQFSFRCCVAMKLFAICCALCSSVALAAESRGPSVVKVVPAGDGWKLTRNGEPYLIRGVGGDTHLDMLANVGGNSIRTWSAEKIEPVLDEAQRLGLTVTVGLWLGHERHGFDYNNADQVAAQADAVKQAVLKFKDHSAVLMWALGNEMEGYGAGDNAAVWSAINNLAVMVKKLDPNHPTMTVVAEIGGDRVKNIHRLCPEIDVVGINSYGGAASLPKRYRDAGGTKPYVVTEFGPPGIWEVPKKTAWGATPELTSTAKAAFYKATYEANVTGNAGHCLGSCAFLWGQKQEATATWFGLLLPDGSRLAAVDALSELWTGKPPENRCPVIKSLKLAGDSTGEAKLKPLATVTAQLEVADPENDPLNVQWLLQAEPLEFGVGGDAEAAPPTFREAIVKPGNSSVEVRMPESGGGYRLFAYVRDGKGGAAVANLPLHVDAPVKVPEAKMAALPFVVYNDAGRDKPPYVPTGWMGNAKAMKLDEACKTDPHSGQTCMKFDFTASDGWGGIVWQSPPNDWGDKPGGWNLTGAKKLTFWARGEQGGEVASFELGILKSDKKFHDSTNAKLEKTTLTTEWQQFTIELTGRDLSRIKTGFVISVGNAGRPLTIYLDDVQYEAK